MFASSHGKLRASSHITPTLLGLSLGRLFPGNLHFFSISYKDTSHLGPKAKLGPPYSLVLIEPVTPVVVLVSHQVHCEVLGGRASVSVLEESNSVYTACPGHYVAQGRGGFHTAASACIINRCSLIHMK